MQTLPEPEFPIGHEFFRLSDVRNTETVSIRLGYGTFSRSYEERIPQAELLTVDSYRIGEGGEISYGLKIGNGGWTSMSAEGIRKYGFATAEQALEAFPKVYPDIVKANEQARRSVAWTQRDGTVTLSRKMMLRVAKKLLEFHRVEAPDIDLVWLIDQLTNAGLYEAA